ncbi:MAG: anthranilate phosphoribosyltransferase [bacterium]
MMQEIIRTVIAGEHLTREQAYRVMNTIMTGEATPAQIAAFLVAEKLKGETYQEVAGFATAMREKATPVSISRRNAVDIVGTGGDGANTFNISTVAAFVMAAAGVPVAKHGNRSVSSKCGSADVLELLGVRIDLSASQIGRCVDEVGIGFLFAPGLHKAMKHAMAPRKEVGVRTVFNILGPVTNPAGVRRQVVGVFDRVTARLVAEVFRELGADHIFVVHSEDGLDEVSVHAPTLVFEVKKNQIQEKQVVPEDFGLKTATAAEALGGHPEKNTQVAREVLSGQGGVARDFVVANAACGLVVGAVVQDFQQGARMAAEAIDSGAAMAKLQALKELTHSFV